MFNYIFLSYKLNKSDPWIDALTVKENKKYAVQGDMRSTALAVQKEQALRTNQSMVAQSHSINAVSGNEADEQQIGDIYSELDTVPLPLFPVSLAF